MLRDLSQLLPGRFMDLEIGVGGRYRARVIERPGLWMSADDLDDLVADLRLVAESTLEGGALAYGVFSGDRARFEQTIMTIVYRREDGRPIAFNALSVIELMIGKKPVDVMHLGLVMIDPDDRNQRLSWVLYGLSCFLMFLRNQMRPIWVSNVTQVPAVVGMVAEAFDAVYPAPDPRARRSLTHRLIARQIMAEHRHVFGVGADASFDEDDFVIENAYTGGSDDLKKTFEETAKHREAAVNAFCRDRLDYERGDDILQIGRMTLPAARRYIVDMVPRASRARLAITGLTAFLQRLVLPVWYWLDGSRQWGSLRPWRS